METGDGPPEGLEARELLDAAVTAEHATRNPPLPWTFFVAQASPLTIICVAQLLPYEPARAVTIVSMLAIVGIGIRHVYARPGYGIVWPDVRQSLPYVVAVCVLAGIPALLAEELDIVWLWPVAGTLAGATTLEMGRRYRLEAGHG